MQIDVPEIIEIPDYTDTERYSELKNKVFMMAKDGRPFNMDELPSAEYKYYGTMWHIFKRLIAKEITPDQAKQENETAYKAFTGEQTLYNSRLFELIEFNDRIRKSDLLRAKMSKAGSLIEYAEAATECVIALTNDKTLAAKLDNLKGGAT